MQPSMDDDEPGRPWSRRLARECWWRMAERPPVLLVIEDAQWAEPALLDLVEDVTSGDLRVPLVALCVARDELLRELAPAGAPASRNETIVTLDAIDDGRDAPAGDRARGDSRPAAERRSTSPAATRSSWRRSWRCAARAAAATACPRPCTA